MRVLQLTTVRSSFFQDQVLSLQENGIKCDILAASDWRKHKNEQSKNDIRFRKRLWDTFENMIGGFNPIYYSAASLRFQSKIIYKIFNNNYDIIHSNSAFTAPFAVIQPQRPVVMTFWGSCLQGDRLYGYSENMVKFCAKRADATIVRNNKMKKKLDQNSKVIPSGVDLQKFKPQDKKLARTKLDWEQNEYYIIFVNNPKKKVKRFNLAKKVASQVDSMCEKNVNLYVVSGVPHNQISTYMNAADVLLLTSKNEGSPNVVKEAMACNCPVVSTNVGDVKQRVKNVNNSYVCESEMELVKAVVSVLRNGGRTNGRENINKLGKERIAERIIEVYEDTLKKYE